MAQESTTRTIDDLFALARRLHAPEPDGCPWCLAQTPGTLADETIKEAHELAAAADAGDPHNLAEELGDILFQLVTQAHLGETAGQFDWDEVVQHVHDKIVRRHPHIFGDSTATTTEEVLQQWQAIKREERGDETSVLAGIPVTLPALVRAEEMQARAARVGFDWPAVTGVTDKIHEEVDELAAAESGEDRQEEFGDLLFALVNLARWEKFSAERALQRASDKFAHRFAFVEAACRAQGAKPEELTLEQLDAFWDEAKAAERNTLASDTNLAAESDATQ